MLPFWASFGKFWATFYSYNRSHWMSASCDWRYFWDFLPCCESRTAQKMTKGPCDGKKMLNREAQKRTMGTYTVGAYQRKRQKEAYSKEEIEIDLAVKQVWNVAMLLLHNLWGFVINMTSFHLGRYSLHLLLLQSSMSQKRQFK